MIKKIPGAIYAIMAISAEYLVPREFTGSIFPAEAKINLLRRLHKH